MLHYIFVAGCGRSCLSKYRVLVYAKSANNNNKEYLLFDLCVCVCTILVHEKDELCFGFMMGREILSHIAVQVNPCLA